MTYHVAIATMHELTVGGGAITSIITQYKCTYDNYMYDKGTNCSRQLAADIDTQCI